MKKHKHQESSAQYEPLPNPTKLGAKECPNCKTDSHMTISSKTLGVRALFVEVTCNKCFRTAISEVEASLGPAIRGSIARWNSLWPDVAYFLDGPSEGFKDIK